MKRSKLITMGISLLAAICLWAYVVTVVNPDGDTIISGIPVTFSGQEVLREDQGLIIKGDYDDMVSVHFYGKNTDLKKLEQYKDEITAVVDVSKVRSAKEYQLSYQLTLPNAVQASAVQVTDRNPSVITIQVEKLAKREIEVRGDFSGVGDIHFFYSADEVLYGALPDFEAACAKAGVPYTAFARPGMVHCYCMLPCFREAKEDFAKITDILRK